MLVYLDLRRDINCLLTPDEIEELESRVLKGTIFRWGDPKERYPLQISVDRNESSNEILVKHVYDKKDSRLVYISPKSYNELETNGLTKATYFDGTWFGRVWVWDETRIEGINWTRARIFGQVRYDLGIRKDSEK